MQNYTKILNKPLRRPLNCSFVVQKNNVFVQNSHNSYEFPTLFSLYFTNFATETQ